MPLNDGKILDPFAGAGSTLAAAEALGYDSVGIEINEEYFQIAQSAIPELAMLDVGDIKSKNSKASQPQKQFLLPVFGG